MKGLLLGSILAIAMAACLDTDSDPPPSTPPDEVEVTDDLDSKDEGANAIPGYSWYCTNAPVCVIDILPQSCLATCRAIGVEAPRCRYLEEWPTCS